MGLLNQPATSPEYRGRAILLFVSQPILTGVLLLLGQLDGPWYAPRVSWELGVQASILAVLGTWIRIQAASYFSSKTVAQPDPVTDKITMTGPFSSVRNPLYLGSLIEFLGFAVCFGWIPALIYTLLHLWRYQRIVVYEERLLRGVWTTQYDEFVRNVPRWLPRRPWKLLYGARWTSEAILGNGPFIGMCLGIIASTAIGNLLPIIPFEAAGFLVAALHFLLRPRTEPGT